MKKIFFALLIFSSTWIYIGCGNSNSDNTENLNVDETPLSDDELKIERSNETVEINGVKHYIEKMGSGEPLLVLHGGPGLFHDYLTPHFETLAKKYQVIFYDQRGCGKTDFPSDTSSLTLDNFVADLEAIRVYLKLDKLNLVAHSWGTTVALTYAKKFPNNLNRLVLISPAPANSDFFDVTFSNMQKKRSEEDTKELIKTMMSKEFEKRDEKTFRKAILLGDKVNLVDQEKVEELYKPMEFNKTKADNLMIVTSLLEKTYFDFDITKGLEMVNCPTLIILGDLDNVPFSSAQAIQEAISGSQLKVIKKCCHYPFFEDPKEFNFSIKNFLDPEYEQ